MTRDHYGNQVIAPMTRRRALTIAATVGVGASAAGVAGLSLAGTSGKKESSHTAPLVISLRDAKSGTFDLFAGGSKVVLKDKDLAARLIEIARG